MERLAARKALDQLPLHSSSDDDDDHHGGIEMVVSDSGEAIESANCSPQGRTHRPGFSAHLRRSFSNRSSTQGDSMKSNTQLHRSHSNTQQHHHSSSPHHHSPPQLYCNTKRSYLDDEFDSIVQSIQRSPDGIATPKKSFGTDEYGFDIVHEHSDDEDYHTDPYDATLYSPSELIHYHQSNV